MNEIQIVLILIVLEDALWEHIVLKVGHNEEES